MMSSMDHAQKSNNYAFTGIMIVGLSPVLMILIPWDFGAEMSAYRAFMRGLSMTVPLIESVFVLLAAAGGFSLFAAIRDMPRWTRVGFLMLLAIIILGAAFSSKIPVLSLVGLGKISMHALFFLAVRHQVSAADPDLQHSFWKAIGFGLLAYWVLWGINIWLFEPQGREWVTMVPGVTNVRSLGFFAVAGFFAGIAVAMAKAARQSQYLLGIVIAGAALVMAFWTGSRGALLAIMMGLLWLLIFAGSIRNALAKFFAVVFSLAVCISLLLPSVDPHYGIERIIFSSVATPTESDITSGRTEMWRATAKKIAEKPFAGWGVEQFAVSGPEHALGYKQPHNMLLQLLFSTGLLGAIAILLIVLPFLPKLSLEMSSPDRLAAWGVIIGTLTFGLYDAALYYTYPVMVFLLSVTMVLKPIVASTASDKSN
jgi:O-antigen ligase